MLKIVKMIADNPKISMKEMASSLGVSNRTMARCISDLKDYKVIKRIGPDHGGRWEILITYSNYREDN